MPLTHTPNPWTKNSVTIHLSSDRRGKLADYVTGMDGSMTPAEAIYSLIDTASGQEQEEQESLLGLKNQMKILLNHIDAQSKIIEDCSQALRSVENALSSIKIALNEL